MKLQSVKETAKRFNISERRVQKLCEAGRICGAQRISNVWVIPSTAQKPSDDRTVTGDENLISLSELCADLSISTATGRNWVKLGKLVPTCEIRRTPFFSREYVAEIKSNIQGGKSTALKSRRNKKYVSGNHVYHSYVSASSVNLPIVESIVSSIEKRGIEITEDLLCAIIAECAIQMILSKCGEEYSANSLCKYLQGNNKSRYSFLIDDLISGYPLVEDAADLYAELLNKTFIYEEGEDVLGLLYLSLKNIGSRKATGSYYTPTVVVQKLCKRLFDGNSMEGKSVFDPCCGTGNFIIQLPSQISYHHIYGNDIDSMSVQIARINFALRYGITEPAIVYMHITKKDYLSFDKIRRYDFIIGNPPWGYAFTELQKGELRNKYKSAIGNNLESYDIFVEQALCNLNPGGVLSFVLPEAILNVRTHAPIRQIMLNCSSFQYLEFLGNAFDRVQCPCVILQTVFTGTAFNSIGMTVNDGTREYAIQQKRKIDAECLSFSMTDAEYDILEKLDHLRNKVTLLGNAKFALGIVTGNNKDFISQIKTKENETILKGSDLYKYRFNSSDHYIVFKPDLFQQIAPTDYYRAPEKLLYRFICNQLVFAYDDQQTLSLNSCNILIPEIPGVSMKYVLAILNSRIAQFYFKKRFNSVKVLRSYIEQIPIALIEKEAQERITLMVDSILEASEEDIIISLYNQIDMDIAKIYGLTAHEYQIVKSSMEGENLFLI